MTEEEINTIRQRIDLLVGSTRWQTVLSECMGLSRAIVNGWFSHSETNKKRNPPEQLIIALEFLEIVPVQKWPVRWNKLKALKIASAEKANS